MPEFDFIDAAHNAYERLSDPVMHRRRILFVKKSCYWVLVDDLYGSEAHHVEQHFQFDPSQSLLHRDGWTVCSDSERRGLFIGSFSSVDLKMRIRKGDIDPIAGWVSPDYGVRTPSPSLVYSALCSATVTNRNVDRAERLDRCTSALCYPGDGTYACGFCVGP